MTVRPGSPEASILALIHSRGQVSAVEISTACRMTPGQVRGCIIMLESMRFVSSRYDKSTPTRNVYAVTREGARSVDR